MRTSPKLNLSFGRRSLGAVALAATFLWPSTSMAQSSATPSPKPTKSAVAPVFVGPPGWQHAQGGSDGLGSWLHPGDTGYAQNITVQAKDGFASLDALLKAETAYVTGLPDVFGYAPTDTTVCGKHPAKYLSFTYTSSTGLPVTAEMVIAVFGTMGYSARYNKSISQNADAAAEASLNTLCGHAASK